MKISVIIGKWVRKTYMHMCYITRPRKEKTVFFASFRGQYSDNPRAISECLHRMAPEVKIVWLVMPQFKQYVPDYVVTVPPNHRLLLKAQAQAQVWVMNYVYRKQLGVYKGRDNYYIQTWHGDRGLKTIGSLTSYGKKHYKDTYEISHCDLFVAASEYGVKKARQALLYKGEVIVEGMPRNDKLVCINKYSDAVNKIRKILGIGDDVKVMLYAPTYRDDKRSQQCMIDIPASMSSLSKNGDKWICLVRYHSLSKGTSTNSDKSVCLDVTSYPDMADLLLVSDLLITDYSSSAGDFLLTGKPVVLVHFDRSDYEAQGRSLWVNPEEAGFLVAKNQDELNKILSNLYSYNHQAIADKINCFYGTKETGHASETIARRIIEVLKIH